MPVDHKAWDQVLNLAKQESTSEYERISALQEVIKHGATWPVTPEWTEFMPIFWSIIERALARQVTPAEALNEAEVQYKKILGQ
ncbi:hypothetical protein ES705_30353 [subsurface metagenome]